MSAIKSNEVKVLAVLAEIGNADENCFPFAPICHRTGLNREQVRRACRSLARKGLAEFVRGLWTETGEPVGSGYCATKAGFAAIAKAEGGDA